MDEPILLEQTEYDAIVVGTGLTESIVAGALARIGRRVLHLDHRQHYGGNRATLDLKSLLEMTTGTQPSGTFSGWQILTNGEPTTASSHAEELVPVTEALEEPAQAEAPVAPEEPQEDPVINSWIQQSRQFNLDLAPAVLFSRGPLVDSLSRSGVSRYNEFKVVESTNMLLDGKMRAVPCSKNEVFADKHLSLMDKRHLMSFLKTCLDHKADPTTPLKHAAADMPFVSFLQKNKMPKHLQSVICYALAGLETDQHTDPAPASIEVGLAGISQYLESVGRFNTTAFLCLNYGLGELPQAFCRLCAVYNGTYILGRGVTELLTDSDTGRCTGLVCSAGQTLSAPVIVSDPEYLQQFKDPAESSAVSRVICIHDSPWIGEGGVAMLSVPPVGGEAHPHPIFMLQSDSGSGTCPEGLFVLYAVTQAVNSAEEDLHAAVEQVTGGQAPLWVNRTKPLLCAMNGVLPQAAYYTQATPQHSAVPEGVFACPAPRATLLVEQALLDAQAIFNRICPEEADEFLPKMPDPEDDEDDI